MKSIESIQAYDYGFGVLENKLISLFRSGAPDFETADELLRLGANINAENGKDAESILSEIVAGYWWSESGENCKQNCEEHDCEGCPYNDNQDPNCGSALLRVIQYFLDNGFDLHRQDDRVGATCLWRMTLSVYSRRLIDATKLLLNAGAKNICITDNPNGRETPWSFIATEGSCLRVCHNNYHMGNIFEAIYQIYQAIEDGKDYSGIDSYEAVFGKRIDRVLSAKPDHGIPFYETDLPNFKHRDCFTQPLFFITDTGVLYATQYLEYWFDDSLPDIETIDVSAHFPGIVGSIVKRFHFDHNEIREANTIYGQPVVTIETEDRQAVTFTTNFGEVSDDAVAAYFYLGWPKKNNR